MSEPTRLSQRDADQLRSLRRLVKDRRPELMPVVDTIGSRPLTPDERETLRAVVADELVTNGLTPNDEPTPHGVFLESLIDWLGHV